MVPSRSIFAFLIVVALVAGRVRANDDAAIRMDDAGRFTENGQPIFPLGIYVAIPPSAFSSDPTRELALLDDLAASPFKMLINYADPECTLEERRKYLDALHERGLYAIFSLKDFYLNGTWGRSPFIPDGQTEEQAIRETVRGVEDHPAVIGWYLSDEEPNAANVRQHHRWVKEEDPKGFTLTLTNLSLRHEMAKFAGTGDVLALDVYPIGNGGAITDVGERMGELVYVTRGDPAWFVVQAYGGYQNWPDNADGSRPKMPTEGRGRPPTAQEMCCMTYQALASGATGIVIYYYKDIKNADDSAERWTAVKAIGSEVKDLTAVLLADDVKQRAITGDNDHVQWRATLLDNQVYLIVANASVESQRINFDMSGKLRACKFRSGGGSAKTMQDKLVLELAGYEGAVIEVTLDTVDTKRLRQATQTAAGAAETVRIPEGRGGYWRFEWADADLAADSMGPSADNGSVVGPLRHSTQTFAPVVPRLGVPNTGSLESFAIEDTSLTVNSPDSVDLGDDDFTLEAWIKPRSADAHPIIAGKKITGNFEDKGYELRLRPKYDEVGNVRYVVGFVGGPVDGLIESGEYAFGEWRHVAVTRKGPHIVLYVDGTEAAQAKVDPAGTFASRQLFAIGCGVGAGDGSPTNHFDGFIDEVRLIIGEALPPSQFLYAPVAATKDE